ncbi:MAG: DUF2203 domain-containing protein [Ignavibacteriaceae bacterium]|nr:DUF2203 domain-containing protein [Ignavibacteriaceae bacterium]
MIETKYFTPSEAKKTLPLVRQIVKDILDTTSQMRLLAEEITGSVEENPTIKKMAGDINRFIKELEEIGCYFKDMDFTIGLVDFPSVIAGEDVFLCWRSDEDDIKYFHRVDVGYSGRQLIPEEYY